MMILWLVCRDLNISGPHENLLCAFFHPIKVLLPKYHNTYQSARAVWLSVALLQAYCVCVTCWMVCLLSVWETVHGCDIYYSLSQGSSQGLFTVKARQRRAYFQTALCVRRAATSNQCHSNMPLVSVHEFYVCVFLNSFSWKDVLRDKQYIRDAFPPDTQARPLQPPSLTSCHGTLMLSV